MNLWLLIYCSQVGYSRFIGSYPTPNTIYYTLFVYLELVRKSTGNYSWIHVLLLQLALSKYLCWRATHLQYIILVSNVRGEPTASVLSADGFPLMAGPNFQPSDGNPIVISILRQLADVLENVPEI